MNQFATSKSNPSNAISSNDQFIAPNNILNNNAKPTDLQWQRPKRVKRQSTHMSDDSTLYYSESEIETGDDDSVTTQISKDSAKTATVNE